MPIPVEEIHRRVLEEGQTIAQVARAIKRDWRTVHYHMRKSAIYRQRVEERRSHGGKPQP